MLTIAPPPALKPHIVIVALAAGLLVLLVTVIASLWSVLIVPLARELNRKRTTAA